MRAVELFEANRGRIFAIAYGILGSAADADDVVQDAWLRWSGAPVADVRDPRAYLARVGTRLALNRVRDTRARREAYVGPWLPEPVATGPDAAGPAELAESVSMALLVVLETLTPTQRAVFVLREVFGYSHREIADQVGGTEVSVRQLASRARADVRRRRRFATDRQRHREVTERFLDACAGGDLDVLIGSMTADAVLVSDGGGRVTAALRPVVGAARIGRLLVGLVTGQDFDYRSELVTANGWPTLVGWSGPELSVSVHLVTDGDLIAEILMVRNPDKLRRLQSALTGPAVGQSQRSRSSVDPECW